jgi:hypothetical protein
MLVGTFVIRLRYSPRPLLPLPHSEFLLQRKTGSLSRHIGRGSSEGHGRINMRSFLGSPLVVVGKGFELTGNRPVGHGLGSAEQSLCRCKVFLGSLRDLEGQRALARFSGLIQGDLQPGQPIAVARLASSEASDALPGTKGGSPRVVPDETKPAITSCASRRAAGLKTFGAVGHCSILLVSSSLFADHRFSGSHVMSLCAFPTCAP